MHTITLEKGLATFLDALSGKNRSAATIRAYQTDIAQFIAFLHANNVSIYTPAEVEKIDVMEYLSSLAKKELTGIARARKMSAIREYFRFLEGVALSPSRPQRALRHPNGRRIADSISARMSTQKCSPWLALTLGTTRCYRCS